MNSSSGKYMFTCCAVYLGNTVDISVRTVFVSCILLVFQTCVIDMSGSYFFPTNPSFDLSMYEIHVTLIMFGVCFEDEKFQL